jgi:kynurenine formamidase
MARALLLIIALLIIAAIVMVATGWVSLTQTQSAQAPGYKVEVKDLEVGTTTANVQVPAVGMETRQVEVPKLTLENNSAPAAPAAPAANGAQ